MQYTEISCPDGLEDVLLNEVPVVDAFAFPFPHVALEGVGQNERMGRRVVELLARCLRVVSEPGDVVDGGFLVGRELERFPEKVLPGPRAGRHVQQVGERHVTPFRAIGEGWHIVRDLRVEDLLAISLREVEHRQCACHALRRGEHAVAHILRIGIGAVACLWRVHVQLPVHVDRAEARRRVGPYGFREVFRQLAMHIDFA